MHICAPRLICIKSLLFKFLIYIREDKLFTRKISTNYYTADLIFQCPQSSSSFHDIILSERKKKGQRKEEN